MANSTGY